MDTESRKKSRKYVINVSDLSKALGVSRISLYKYFDLFELLQKELKLSPEQPFGFEEVFKVSPRSAYHFKQDRIEFLNKLRNFYWDFLSNNRDKYSQNEIIFKYFPQSFIEKNFTKSFSANNNFLYKMDEVSKIYDDSEVKIEYKTSMLINAFYAFVKEFQYNNQRDEVFQKLFEYIEFIQSKYKNGK